MIKEVSDMTFLNQQTADLISLAINKDKVDELLRRATLNNKETCFVYEQDYNVVGVITIKNSDNICHITSLATSSNHQLRGIGTQLINHIKETNDYIIAETDDDAVNFYRKQNFVIEPLGEKYPGVKRYKCIYRKY
ncbi:GNAT family N-acetyltransferase [Macrococcus animalis]|uniref:GNAT family N-acetyltransferase n=1 Tax=Macrococcus animalis TaxID=3395467 RepID=UPI0039BEB64D